MIKSLLPNQVFVFGSNSSGFHGAGSAGLAFRGDARNTWRSDHFFLKAMRSPVGSNDRIGRWAVFGISRGFQRGTSGMSFAIQTITRPGFRRSVSLEEISSQLLSLVKFSISHPEFDILMTPVGCGYSGYSRFEMSSIWNPIISDIDIPNLKFSDCYEFNVDISNT